MIDINNRDNIFDFLQNLSPETKPIFGKLTPQGMIEHLSFTVSYSNGNTSYPLLVDEETAARIKAFTLNSKNRIPSGFKSPLLGDEPPLLICQSITQAIELLKNELNDFDNFYKSDKMKLVMQPVMGELNYFEWVIYHNQHFTHHFKQFGLLA